MPTVLLGWIPFSEAYIYNTLRIAVLHTLSVGLYPQTRSKNRSSVVSIILLLDLFGAKFSFQYKSKGLVMANKIESVHIFHLYFNALCIGLRIFSVLQKIYKFCYGILFSV
jgi:hypothetical protein